MQIALYRGTSLISKLIRWQTRGEYSHAAVILLDSTAIEAWHKPGQVRRQQSLSQGHTPGTAVDIFDVELEPRQEFACEDFLRRQLGAPYDFMAIARFLTKRDADSQEKWFCSELVFAAYEFAGVELLQNITANRVHPSMLSYSPLLKFNRKTVAA